MDTDLWRLTHIALNAPSPVIAKRISHIFPSRVKFRLSDRHTAKVKFGSFYLSAIPKIHLAFSSASVDRVWTTVGMETNGIESVGNPLQLCYGISKS